MATLSRELKKMATLSREHGQLASLSREHGQLDADPEKLKEIGAAAVKEGDYARAARMYTFAIDMLVAAGGGEEGHGRRDWVSLERESQGLLHVLLSNRSFTHYKQGDWAAAAEDAESCVSALPTFVKGHLRLLRALEEAEAPVEQRARIIGRALRACPGSKPLLLAKDALVKDLGASFEHAMARDNVEAAQQQMADTKRIADDTKDPRHAMAAGDYGSALATGAFGVRQDIAAAEIYLKRGADLGDGAAAKNLGMLLLSLHRPTEAAQYLRKAADSGDADAADTLQGLAREADQKRDAAMFKLRAMAEQGDQRAIAMLHQLDAEAAAAAMQQAQQPQARQTPLSQREP